MKLKRDPGNPVLAPDPAHPWESLVTTNPGAWFDEDRQEVLLLYRACDDDSGHRIGLGLAVSKDGRSFTRVSDAPVFAPSKEGFDAGCVEDPRLVKIGDWYVFTYACRAFPPGQYWKSSADRKYEFPGTPSFFPLALRENKTMTGLAFTRDFRTFIRAGRITDPRLDDRDCYLFPEQIGGKWWRIHRPAEWVGAAYGNLSAPAMWIGSSTDLLAWGESQILIRPKFDWEGNRIGGNTPPLRTEAGWLTLYHGKGDDDNYRLGALLLDLDDPVRVIGRTKDWILQPEASYETDGCYQGGVVFPCGKVVIDGVLHVYYGAADKYVGLATCALDALLDELVQTGP